MRIRNTRPAAERWRGGVVFGSGRRRSRPAPTSFAPTGARRRKERGGLRAEGCLRGGGSRRMSRQEGRVPRGRARDCNNRFFLLNLQIKSLIVIVMRKEFGKWLMDIAKYIATAVVLSSVFGEADTWVIYIGGAVSVLAILIIGLLLVSDRPFRIHRDNRVNSNN